MCDQKNLPYDKESIDTVRGVPNGLVEEVALRNHSHGLVVCHVEYRQVRVNHDHPYH